MARNACYPAEIAEAPATYFALLTGVGVRRCYTILSHLRLQYSTNNLAEGMVQIVREAAVYLFTDFLQASQLLAFSIILALAAERWLALGG